MRRTLIENLDVAFLVDDADTILRGASVVVEDDRIADIGPAAEVAERLGPARVDRVVDGDDTN